MMLGGDYSWAEPDDVQELGDLQDLELAGLRFVVDHTPGHTEGSVTFRSPYDADVSEVMFSGDLLFAGSIGRTDLPGGDHATMLASLATKVLPLADDVVVLPGHGEQTSIGRERATNPFLQDLPGRMTQKITPLSGFPELLPAERVVEQQAIDTLRRVFELHGFAGIETRAVEPLDRLRQGRRDRQGDLRPAPAARPTTRARATPGWACTSTSPCRSRATCWRTPASSSSRSGATRSSRPGAASGPRSAATASSPRPTSTSSARASSPSTTTSRSMRVMVDALGAPAAAAGVVPVQQPQADPGLLPRPRHRRRRPRRSGSSTSSTSCPPRWSPSSCVERRRRARPSRPSGASSSRRSGSRTRPSSSGCAHSASRTSCSRPGLDRARRGRRGLRRRWRRRPGHGRGQPADRARARLLHRHRRRDLHERLRAPQVRRRRRPVRRARRRRQERLPRRRASPSASPARWSR